MTGKQSDNVSVSGTHLGTNDQILITVSRVFVDLLHPL
jgi:hypothetical protein